MAPLNGSPYCYNHAPNLDEIRRRSRARGGAATRHLESVIPGDAPPSLRTMAEIQAFLELVALDTIRQRNSNQRNRTLTAISALSHDIVRGQQPEQPSLNLLVPARPELSDEARRLISERIEQMATRQREVSATLARREMEPVIVHELPGPLLPGDDAEQGESDRQAGIRPDDPDRRVIVRAGPHWISGGQLGRTANLSDPPGRERRTFTVSDYATLRGR